MQKKTNAKLIKKVTSTQAPSFNIHCISQHNKTLSKTLHFHPYEYHMTGSIFTAVENVFRSLQSHSNGRKRTSKGVTAVRVWYMMLCSPDNITVLGIMGTRESLSCRELILLGVNAPIAAVEMSLRRSVITTHRTRLIHVVSYSWSACS